MSRVRHFARALASGYLLLGANIVFTLLQWPLAMRYLGKEEFGLWAVVASLSLSLQLLVDFGMSGSISRILIDHKDDRTGAGYGTVLKTGCLALAAQGGMIALVGSAVSLGLPHWMSIAEGLQGIFQKLMIGYCLLLGLAFPGRMGAFLLQAHQRIDLVNHAQLIGFFVNLLTLWLGFEWGLGLYSLLLSKAAEVIFVSVAGVIASAKLGLFPNAQQRGRADWRTFRGIFSYANEIFLLSVGQAFIATSQTLLVTMILGLEANAVWTTMTKIFVLANQLIGKVFDFSSTSFAEMMVRNERERLHARFRDVTLLTGSLGVFVCVGVALSNASFVQLWMHGKFSWPMINDLLVAFFVLAGLCTRCHIGLAGLTKQIGAMKYLLLVEGVVFVALALLLTRPFGLAGLIVSGLLANLACSGTYGVWRSKTYFHTSPSEVTIGWLQRPALLLGALLAGSAGLWLATRHLPALPQLVAQVLSFGVLGGVAFWQIGLSKPLRAEIKSHLPKIEKSRPV